MEMKIQNKNYEDEGFEDEHRNLNDGQLFLFMKNNK